MRATPLLKPKVIVRAILCLKPRIKVRVKVRLQTKIGMRAKEYKAVDGIIVKEGGITTALYPKDRNA